MRLLVTGGAGFIGSNFVRRMLSHSDHEMVVYDALTYAGRLDNLAEALHDDRVEFVRGDVCDRAAVAGALSGCEAVVHFAAESHVDRSIVDADAFVRTNCDGTNVVCDEARRAGVRRVVHISTDEVYGSIEEGSFDEQSPLAPSSPYAASKAGSDLIALSYWRTHGLNVSVTRSSNNFGPFQHPEKLIPLFISRLLDGEAAPLYGDGRNVRDWLHVDDNCAAIATVLDSGGAGEIYNIGANSERANIDVARCLAQLCGRDLSAVVTVADRPGHDLRYSLDCSKIAALGWAPSRSFDEALSATVEWYRTNPHRRAPKPDSPSNSTPQQGREASPA